MTGLRDDIADSIIYHPGNRNAEPDARERISFMLADAVMPVVEAHLERALADPETLGKIALAVAEANLDYVTHQLQGRPLDAAPAWHSARAVLAALRAILGGTP